MTPLHPLLAPLGDLVGTWVGDGTGQLPGRASFVWQERFEIGHAGTPMLWFRQRTTRPDGTPFHAEDGWVRVPPELQDDPPGPDDRAVELAVASPTGVLESLGGRAGRRGQAAGVGLDVSSTSVTGTPSAGEVLSTRRRWTCQDDTLLVEFWMATPADPVPFHHLTARLRRAS